MDIGINPPQWLAQRAETDLQSNLAAGRELGNMVGTAFAAAVNWATKDPDATDPLTGEPGKGNFWTNYQEARLNQTNPLWSLQAQQQRQQILANNAKMQQQQWQFKLMADQHQKEAEEAPTAMAWLAKPDWDNPPKVESPKWMTAVEKSQQVHAANVLKQQAMDAREKQVQNQIDKTNLQADFDRQKLAAAKAALDEREQGKNEREKEREQYRIQLEETKNELAIERLGATARKLQPDQQARLRQLHGEIASIDKQIAAQGNVKFTETTGSQLFGGKGNAKAANVFELRRQKLDLQRKAIKIARGESEEPAKKPASTPDATSAPANPKDPLNLGL